LSCNPSTIARADGCLTLGFASRLAYLLSEWRRLPPDSDRRLETWAKEPHSSPPGQRGILDEGLQGGPGRPRPWPRATQIRGGGEREESFNRVFAMNNCTSLLPPYCFPESRISHSSFGPRLRQNQEIVTWLDPPNHSDFLYLACPSPLDQERRRRCQGL
jgi:hypothetical protein